MTSTEIVVAEERAQASTSVVNELTIASPARKEGSKAPSGTEVAKVAGRLGIDPVFDQDLLYIAEEFLLTPLPEGWSEYSNDDGRIYYFDEETRDTQWSHPLEEYFKGIVFMRKIGFNLLERNLQEHPPSPAEVREMAKYYGVSLRDEWHVIPFVKLTVNAPLPPEWEEYEEDDGSNCYVHVKTGKKSNRHPLDAYFLEIIRQKREEVEREEEGDGGEVAGGSGEKAKAKKIDFARYSSYNDATVPEPWVEFFDKKLGKKYYFNFVANERTYFHPSRIMKADIVQDASVLIQACARAWLTRKRREQQKMSESAAVIQRSWMRRQKRQEGRKLLEIMKYRDSTPQIVLIQRTFKKHLVAKKEVERKEGEAAVLIQSHWRGHKTRTDVPVSSNRKDRKLPDVSKTLLQAESMDLKRLEESIEKLTKFQFPPEPLVEPSILQAESSNSTVISVKKLKPKPKAKAKRRKRRSTMATGRRGSVASGRRSSMVGAAPNV